MTSWADKVPVDEITARARQARPGRVLVTLVLGLFFLAGWLAGVTVSLVFRLIIWLAGKAWYGLADCVVAARIGYRRARGPLPVEASQPEAGA